MRSDTPQHRIKRNTFKRSEINTFEHIWRLFGFFVLFVFDTGSHSVTTTGLKLFIHPPVATLEYKPHR